MRTTFSLRRRNYYPWLFLAMIVTGYGAIFLFVTAKFSPEFLLSITGAIAALVHFWYSQHNQNTDRFIGLFRNFNARYDDLNDKLNALLSRSGVLLLSGEDKQLLYDYFNLCAEEYLFFKSGYIDTEVWRSWLQGMRYFASNPEVQMCIRDRISIFQDTRVV